MNGCCDIETKLRYALMSYIYGQAQKSVETESCMDASGGNCVAEEKSR